GAVLLCNWRRLAQGWLWIFAGLNCAFLTINTMDAELYNFTAKRFAWSSFFLASEAHLSNVIVPYLPLAFASFCIVALFLTFSFLFIRRFDLKAGTAKKALVSFLIIAVSILASRGGLQHKPITYVDAKIFDNTYGNNLVLNSTFTIIKSASKKSLQRVNVANQDEMLAQLNPRTEQDFKVEPSSVPLNIVIIILESFSEEYSELREPEVMPYFNSLRRQSVDFKKGYANGRRSIEGIAAILSGIPALMEEPFIDSEFSANQVIGLGNLLTQHGYKTSFFHAANKGSMHFDSFSRSVGVEKYYAREDYPNPADDDGTWGIFDEPFLKWTCGQLTNGGAPFLTAIFTLSSHQPYNLPASHRTLKDDRLDILKSVKYADYSLEQFMKCAQQQPWFKN
ncbi:MAG: LTA synthase family protein, partial [Bdellovibrionaceae bacterium]|nr:LTA synthase family protein [Pseudobdellovibrionaceae bacterium]